MGVGLTDRRNALCELLSRPLVHQGFSGPLVELPGDGAELGLFEARVGDKFSTTLADSGLDSRQVDGHSEGMACQAVW